VGWIGDTGTKVTTARLAEYLIGQAGIGNGDFAGSPSWTRFELWRPARRRRFGRLSNR
jgi:hypothetical protein